MCIRDSVITKDLSRLGRNYLQTGHLIEDFFPRDGVRYIAMNDGIAVSYTHLDVYKRQGQAVLSRNSRSVLSHSRIVLSRQPS